MGRTVDQAAKDKLTEQLKATSWEAIHAAISNLIRVGENPFLILKNCLNIVRDKIEGEA